MKGLMEAIQTIGLGFEEQTKFVLKLPTFFETFLLHLSILFIFFFSLMKNLFLGKDFPPTTDHLEQTGLHVHFLLGYVCFPCLPLGV